MVPFSQAKSVLFSLVLTSPYPRGGWFWEAERSHLGHTISALRRAGHRTEAAFQTYCERHFLVEHVGGGPQDSQVLPSSPLKSLMIAALKLSETLSVHILPGALSHRVNFRIRETI